MTVQIEIIVVKCDDIYQYKLVSNGPLWAQCVTLGNWLHFDIFMKCCMEYWMGLVEHFNWMS